MIFRVKVFIKVKGGELLFVIFILILICDFFLKLNLYGWLLYCSMDFFILKINDKKDF